MSEDTEIQLPPAIEAEFGKIANEIIDAEAHMVAARVAAALIPEGDKRRVKRAVVTFLTPEETAALGRLLGELRTQHNEVTEEKRAAMRGYKQRLAAIDEQMDALLPKLQTGKDTITVDCVWLMHQGAGGVLATDAKRLVRLDTGDDVEVVPMTAEDKQLDLPLPFTVVTDTPPPDLRRDDIRIGGFTGAATAATDEDDGTEEDDTAEDAA